VTEKIGSGKYLLFDLKTDKTEANDLFAERPVDAKRLRAALDTMSESVAKSRAGADYSEGKVTREGPHGRVWFMIPEFQPFLKDWAARPEYKNWVNRQSRKKKMKQK
jgi:hypothetical protein